MNKKISLQILVIATPQLRTRMMIVSGLMIKFHWFWHQKLIQLAILVTKLGVITVGAQRMSGSLEQCLGINRHPLMMQVERWLH